MKRLILIGFMLIFITLPLVGCGPTPGVKHGNCGPQGINRIEHGPGGDERTVICNDGLVFVLEA